MKKILGLTIAALLVMGLVGAGTFAYFSDVETSTNNVLLAGTLDLGLSNTSGTNPDGSVSATWNVTAGNWAPGDTLDATLYVYNGGSIAMTHVTANITYGSITDGTPATVSGSPWTTDPTDYLDKMITATTAEWGLTGSLVSITNWANQPLDTIAGLADEDLGTLAAGEEKELHIVFTFDVAATNGTQGDQLTMVVNLLGTQAP